MSKRTLDIGVVTDEISRDLSEALRYARSWGIRQFELREGAERRFPFFSKEEVALVDGVVRAGEVITAVSPGIFKQSVGDETETRRHLDDVLPRSIELAARFDCRLIIVFGFEKQSSSEGSRERTVAQKAFAAAAEQVAGAGMTIAIENEPNFWIDGPDDAVEMLREIGHPGIRLNWDPANRIWGGATVSEHDFEIMRDFIVNLHVKDYDPADEQAPWVPVGQGTINWTEILSWVAAAGLLDHVTLETHCANGVESSRRSFETLRELVGGL